MKTILLALLLLSASLSLPASDLTEQNFWDLSSWTLDEQTFYISGFMMGSWAASNLADLNDYADAYRMNVNQEGEAVLDVLLATLLWYKRTRSWETPIYIAIYRRNLDY
jgi:hypothetical protein